MSKAGVAFLPHRSSVSRRGPAERRRTPAAEESRLLFVWPDVYTERRKENDMEPLGKLRKKKQSDRNQRK